MLNNNNNDNLIEVVVSTNKCTKVVKGGKNLSFAVLSIVGDKKGRVSYGIGKAREVADARTKAFTNAKKKLIKIPLKESRTVHYDIETTFSACKVIIRSAPSGTGIIAGNIQRNIFECLGIKDVVAKSVGTTNPYNVVFATFKALTSIDSPKNIADRRGKNIGDIIKRRNKLISSNNIEEGK